MKKDKNIIYFIKDEDNLDGFNQISPDQNFYFNEDDNLVIVFNQGEVAPSSMGTPEFVIPDEIFYMQ